MMHLLWTLSKKWLCHHNPGLLSQASRLSVPKTRLLLWRQTGSWSTRTTLWSVTATKSRSGTESVLLWFGSNKKHTGFSQVTAQATLLSSELESCVKSQLCWWVLRSASTGYDWTQSSRERGTPQQPTRRPPTWTVALRHLWTEHRKLGSIQSIQLSARITPISKLRVFSGFLSSWSGCLSLWALWFLRLIAGTYTLTKPCMSTSGMKPMSSSCEATERN